MRIEELFKSTGITQSFGGTAPRLDKENCQIVNKTKDENFILLHLKRAPDGAEGQAHLRVQEKFKNVSHQLLNWAFENGDIIGLTLNQLENLETNLKIENIRE